MTAKFFLFFWLGDLSNLLNFSTDLEHIYEEKIVLITKEAKNSQDRDMKKFAGSAISRLKKESKNRLSVSEKFETMGLFLESSSKCFRTDDVKEINNTFIEKCVLPRCVYSRFII